MKIPAFARALAERIVAVCDAEQVLLFGSWAKGRADAHSDVDLIVVMSSPASVRLRACIEDAVKGVPMKVDVLTWGPGDVAGALADPHSFKGSALRHAVVLHAVCDGLRSEHQRKSENDTDDD